MKQQTTKYIVTNVYSGETFETSACSEEKAINNIHFKLWFEKHIWTEMEDFEAEPECLIRLRELKNDKSRNKRVDFNAKCSDGLRNQSQSEQYVQLSFSF